MKMPSKAQLLLREYLISEVDELSEGETLSGEVFDELAEEIGKKVNCFPAQYVKWLVPISKDFPDLFDQLLEAVDLENFPALVTQLCSDVALMEEGLQTGNGSELSRGAAEWKSARDKLMPEDEAEWNEFLEELEKKDGKFFSEETEEEWEKRISEDEDDWGSIFPEEDDDWENHLSEAADILNKYFPEDDDIWRN